MDALENPFSPGAGSRPPEIVGRDQILEQARILLGRVLKQRSEKSMLLTGLRGVGKTVLLNEIERMANRQGYKTLIIEAHENIPLGCLLVPYLRTLLLELDKSKRISHKVQKSLAILRSFANSIKITVSDVTFGLNIDPEKGIADSGNLEIDLPNLFVAIAEAAEEQKCAIAILIDELQDFSREELGALIVSMHKIQQKQLPLVLLGAGLPILPSLAGEAKSYAERLFSFPCIGALSEQDVFKALQEPAQIKGAYFEADAIQEIYNLTKGYPYFLQEWGSQAWNISQSKNISLSTVKNATDLVIFKLDQGFFRVRFDRLTPSEKRFLRAMAESTLTSPRIGDIANILGNKPSSLSPTRAKLIQKGMIYSPSYGDVAFTVPLFDEFMKRALPNLNR